MPDDRRVYSDEEFAVILRKAAELATGRDTPAAASSGLTLTEMKAAAAQAGFDPVLVERAARMLVEQETTSPVERLIGGPLRHKREAHFPIELDARGAARLLSVVRIAAGVAGQRDVGHSSPMGMTWHDGGEMESLGVTARAEGDGTTVSIALDRRATMGVSAMVSGLATFFVVLFSAFALYPEAPALGIGGFIAGFGGILAAARGYWASSSRKAQERIAAVMDVIGQTLDRPAAQESGLREISDAADSPEPDQSAFGERR